MVYKVPYNRKILAIFLKWASNVIFITAEEKRAFCTLTLCTSTLLGSMSWTPKLCTVRFTQEWLTTCQQGTFTRPCIASLYKNSAFIEWQILLLLYCKLFLILHYCYLILFLSKYWGTFFMLFVRAVIFFAVKWEDFLIDVWFFEKNRVFWRLGKIEK